MQPYYDESGIRIYHGDCRDVLPLYPVRHFGLAIADPPYGIGETGARNATRGIGRGSKIEGGRKLPKASHYELNEYDKEPWEQSHFDALFRVTKNQIIWGGNYYTQFLRPSPCWIIWDKDNVGTPFADAEIAWCSFDKAARIFRFKWNGMLQQDMRNKEPRLYLGQKPKALYRWILQKYAKPGQVILDPSIGSGRSLRACRELGFEAVGIDRNERACEIAATRLSRVANELPGQETLAFEQLQLAKGG
jgi:site-specific DNA-methyltransferase (adenine-specific)